MQPLFGDLLSSHRECLIVIELLSFSVFIVLVQQALDVGFDDS